MTSLQGFKSLTFLGLRVEEKLSTTCREKKMQRERNVLRETAAICQESVKETSKTFDLSIVYMHAICLHSCST